jgi:hypothetical protein
MKTAEKVASSIGKGLVAGFAGTAAMTVSSTLEARLRGRASSSAPARATAKVLGIASFEDAVMTSPTGATGPDGGSCAVCSTPPGSHRGEPRRRMARPCGAAHK